MKLLKPLFLTLTTILLASPAAAHISNPGSINTKPMEKANSWVVLPGARLVAGNPHQDEFYILERNSATPIAAAPKFATTLGSRRNATKINLAVKKTFHRVAHKKGPVKMVALKTKKHKIANKKSIHKVKLAIVKKHPAHKPRHTLLTDNH